MKKAVTLLMEVRATLAPVLFKHSPVRSCGGGRSIKITEAKHSLSDFSQKAVTLEINYNCHTTDMSDINCNIS